MMSLDWYAQNAYLKCTNYCVYIFSRISQILVDFVKLNTCKILFQMAFAKINTKNAQNSYFPKINTRIKICTENIG